MASAHRDATRHHESSAVATLLRPIGQSQTVCECCDGTFAIGEVVIGAQTYRLCLGCRRRVA